MSAAEKYANQGHPTIEELIVEQGVVFPRDPRDLLGDFWPEEESIEDFLRAMRDGEGTGILIPPHEARRHRHGCGFFPFQERQPGTKLPAAPSKELTEDEFW